MNINLIQPLYDILQRFYPEHFFTNPFWSFLIDCMYFAFGTAFLYIIFVLPVKYVFRAFKGRLI